MSSRLSDLFLSSQSDERLVSLAQAGHERAFVAIVERYRPELAAFARRLSSDGRGEDVVQQAFLSAFAALRSGCEVKHLRGWLYQIVRNASATERAPLSVPLDSATASADTLEDIVQQRALAMAALSELGRLPQRQRQAMVGTALGGLGRAEVASSMGLSEGAVRQLVHRARASLRSALTAITPWPLARWLVTFRPTGRGAAGLSAGAPGGAELAAGAASSGGVAIKLGVVLASGTLATGIAAVGLHASRPHRPAGRAATSAHARSGGLRGRVVTSASAAPSAGAATVSGSRLAAVAVPVSLRSAGVASGSGGHGGLAAAGGGGDSAHGRAGAPGTRAPKGSGRSTRHGSGGENGSSGRTGSEGSSGHSGSGSDGGLGHSGPGSDAGTRPSGSGSDGGSEQLGRGSVGADNTASHDGGAVEPASAARAGVDGEGSQSSYRDQSPSGAQSGSSGDGPGTGSTGGSDSATAGSTSTSVAGATSAATGSTQGLTSSSTSTPAPGSD